MSTVWIIDDDQSVRFVVERSLRRIGHQVRGIETIKDARSALAHNRPDVLITDIRLEDGNGLELLSELRETHPRLPVIVMTAYSDLNNAVAAYQGGAFEYLAKPFDIQALQEAVQRAALNADCEPAPQHSEHGGMLGQSTSMQELFRTIGRLSTTDVNVLITGETGTGKELVAKALHQHGPRHSAPFVAINSAAVPSELLESELFGHEKGAFTGAVQRYQGRFEQAQGGTLFLDEIGDMPLPLQSRLLRVLAEGDYYRVGGHDLLKADVRIIAATHQNLSQRVAEQAFRADLYHRLNVVHIHVPPLRERRDDIALLAEHFLNLCATELGLEHKFLHGDSLALLSQADWQGNVRELKNLCQHLLVMAPGDVILPGDLPTDYQKTNQTRVNQDWREALRQQALASAAHGARGSLSELRDATRDILVRSALQSTRGKVGEAAQLLGVGRNTLSRWLKDFADSAVTKKSQGHH